MENDTRIHDDLTDKEYEDYEKHPENWENVTNNTIDYYRDCMGIEDDE